MKMRILLGILAALIASAVLLAGRSDTGPTKQTDDSIRVAITAVLNDQVTSWNRGDVNAFMKAYWNSPELTFAGSSGFTRGWQPVLDHYRKNYPDQKAMGQLDFSQLEVHPLGQNAVLVLGHWHLKRASDELSGVFTLIFQKFPDGWKIIHDHSSLESKKS
ncbi:MAG: nuclear transport factor 2 family protein [Candidatus Acidiferrum sp.]